MYSGLNFPIFNSKATRHWSPLYVAYGSNLNKQQMRHRCPSAKPVYTGYLNNWELIYRGSKTGSYATIRRKKGYRVPVVVWGIQHSDERNLDIYEGYPRFYSKQNVYVTISDDSHIKAMVYIMFKGAKPGQPSERYIDTIYQGFLHINLVRSGLVRRARRRTAARRTSST